MKPVEVTDMILSYKGKMVMIKGGWEATVPVVTPDARSLGGLASYYGSQGAALEVIQGLFESAWLNSLRHAIKRRCKEYLDLYPEKLQLYQTRYGRHYYTASGFDAEAVQQMWMPFDRGGRPGKPWAKELLEGMAIGDGGDK